MGIILSAVHGGKLVNSRLERERVRESCRSSGNYSASFLLRRPLFPKEGIALIIMAACNRRLFWSRNRFPPTEKKIGEDGGGGEERRRGRKEEEEGEMSSL